MLGYGIRFDSCGFVLMEKMSRSGGYRGFGTFSMCMDNVFWSP